MTTATSSSHDPFSTNGRKSAEFWIGPITLKRRAKPDLENERHRENSLRLSIQEAKNIPAKRRYFCHVFLDRKPWVRTTSKPVSQGVFWGEEFDLNNLPDTNFVTIYLYREADAAKDGTRRKSKHQHQQIAYVTIPVTDISQRGETQRWIPMQPSSAGGGHSGAGTGAGANSRLSAVSSSSSATPPNSTGATTPTSGGQQPAVPILGAGGVPGTGTHLHPGGGSKSQSSGGKHSLDPPQIRIKARYQSIDVLPISCYDELKQFITNDYLYLIPFLEENLCTRSKEAIASCCMNIHEKLGSAAPFLTSIIHKETASQDNDSLIFRSNTIASKSMECYLKLVGHQYLQCVLGGIVSEILQSSADFEVDPQKLSSQVQLGKNQIALTQFVTRTWNHIFDSQESMPIELKLVFTSLRSRLEPIRGPQFVDNLVSASLFLRYLCPALLAPVLFLLAQDFPEEERFTRNFTMVAKVMQSLANLSLFGDKESYMRFLNDFVQREMPNMRLFLNNISKLDQSRTGRASEKCSDGSSGHACHEFIDMGYELAMLHQLLVENSENKELPLDILSLPSILAKISETLNDHLPAPRRGSLLVRRSTTVGTEPGKSVNGGGLTDLRRSTLQSPTSSPLSSYLRRSTCHSVTPVERRKEVGGAADRSVQHGVEDMRPQDKNVWETLGLVTDSPMSSRQQTTPKEDEQTFINEKDINECWRQIVALAEKSANSLQETAFGQASSLASSTSCDLDVAVPYESASSRSPPRSSPHGCWSPPVRKEFHLKAEPLTHEGNQCLPAPISVKSVSSQHNLSASFNNRSLMHPLVANHHSASTQTDRGTGGGVFASGHSPTVAEIRPTICRSASRGSLKAETSGVRYRRPSGGTGQGQGQGQGSVWNASILQFQQPPAEPLPSVTVSSPSASVRMGTRAVQMSKERLTEPEVSTLTRMLEEKEHRLKDTQRDLTRYQTEVRSLQHLLDSTANTSSLLLTPANRNETQLLPTAAATGNRVDFGKLGDFADKLKGIELQLKQEQRKLQGIVDHQSRQIKDQARVIAQLASDLELLRLQNSRDSPVYHQAARPAMHDWPSVNCEAFPVAENQDTYL